MSTTLPNPPATPVASLPMNRREFVAGAAVLAALTIGGKALGSPPELNPARVGVLVDLTRCVGCRRCEWACAEANANPHGAIEEYDDQSVMTSRRAPTADQFCVINRVPAAQGASEAAFMKVQCMHCEKPPCVSACLVGAMRKDPSGPVTYDASRCIGCRYCMMACPFERLAYEYERKLTPRVRKCEMCRHRTAEGKVPACVEICPVEALQFGTREVLLRIARKRIEAHPTRYADHVYGEHEGGGTSWLYLSGRPFEQLAEVGLPPLPARSPAERTESIQHGIFKWGAAPMILVALLAGLNAVTKKGAKA